MILYHSVKHDDIAVGVESCISGSFATRRSTHDMQLFAAEGHRQRDVQGALFTVWQH